MMATSPTRSTASGSRWSTRTQPFSTPSSRPSSKSGSLPFPIALRQRRPPSRTRRAAQADQLPGPLVPLGLVSAQRRTPRPFMWPGSVPPRLDEKVTAALQRSADSELDRSFGIFKGPPRYIAEILFTGTAAELVKNQVWHRDQRLSARHDGVIMQFPVHDDREIMMKILQYGAQAEVRKPAHSI